MMNNSRKFDKAGNRPPTTTFRLQLEELECRCLLSGLVIPNGALALGPDGNIWFSEWSKIGELNPTTGVFREFDLPAGMLTQRELIAGPDGNLWFPTEDQSAGGQLGVVGIAKMNPTTGVVQEFKLPSGSGPNQQITFGPDGNIWFADWKTYVGYFMGRMDPTTGTVQDFPLSREIGVGPNGGLTVGPDGDLWFSDSEGVGKFNPVTGTLQMYSVGFTKGVAVGPDGAIWFSQGSTGSFQIGRINLSDGSVQEFPVSQGHGFYEGMTTGPDGNIWFSGGSIGTINPSSGALKLMDLPAGADMNWGIVSSKDGYIYFSYSIWDANGDPTGYIGQVNPSTGATRSFALVPPVQVPATSTSTTISPDNSLSASATTVSGLSGIAFNQVVAFFTPQAPIPSSGSAYQASIDWGDGNTSWVILTVAQAGTYALSSGHAYQAAGTYSIKVAIAPNNAASLDSTVTVFSTAQIADLIPLNM